MVLRETRADARFWLGRPRGRFLRPFSEHRAPVDRHRRGGHHRRGRRRGSRRQNRSDRRGRGLRRRPARSSDDPRRRAGERRARVRQARKRQRGCRTLVGERNPGWDAGRHHGLRRRPIGRERMRAGRCQRVRRHAPRCSRHHERCDHEGRPDDSKPTPRAGRRLGRGSKGRAGLHGHRPQSQRRNRRRRARLSRGRWIDRPLERPRELRDVGEAPLDSCRERPVEERREPLR